MMITIRDLALIEKVTRNMPRRNELLDIKQTARMVFLMYQGLAPDAGDPLFWRFRESSRPFHGLLDESRRPLYLERLA